MIGEQPILWGRDEVRAGRAPAGCGYSEGMGTIATFITPWSLYEIMSIQSRALFLSAVAVLLVLACFVAGCTSNPGTPAPAATVTPTPAATPNAIAIKNFAFSPATLTVKTGTAVTWTNDDSAPHTVVSDPGVPAPFDSPSLATGASYPVTFTKEGTYTYHCSIHPIMKGTIIVQP